MNEVSTRFHGKDFIEVMEGGYYDSGQEQHSLLHDEDGMPRNERPKLKAQPDPADEAKKAADEAAKAATPERSSNDSNNTLQIYQYFYYFMFLSFKFLPYVYCFVLRNGTI